MGTLRRVETTCGATQLLVPARHVGGICVAASLLMSFRSVLVISVFLTACIGDAPPDLPESAEPGDGVDDSGDAPTTETLRATVGTSARVAGTEGVGLRLRSGAGSTFAVIRVMPEGATVQVLAGPTMGFYRVTYSGSTGWAHGAYLQTVPTGGGKNNLLPWTANVTFMVTQGHNGGSHTGVGAWAWDFATPIGTPIRAAHVGTVRLVKGNSTGGGCNAAYANDANYVIVDQGNGFESLYLHLSSITVGTGQAVQRGDLVGYSGQTGWSCGPHLHFQIQRSPQGGGGYGFYNQTIRDYFYDQSYASDPTYGMYVTSKNGVSNQPRVVEPEDVSFDPHGSSAEWDLTMQKASHRLEAELATTTTAE